MRSFFRQTGKVQEPRGIERELFNCYLASCQELVSVEKEMPIKTVDKEELKINHKSDKICENITITRKVIAEQRKRTKIPTKLGFYLFMGGMSSNTRKSYEIREDFLQTVEAINNFLERVLESGGLEGTINPQMVQFVLNTSYGRNPKNVIEESKALSVNEEDLIDD